MSIFSVEQQNELIAKECDKLKAMLIDKNLKYGGTALAPLRIASNLTPVDKINVRIEDKIGRMIQGDKSREDEDPYWDLAGYIILRSVAKQVFEVPKAQGQDPLSHLELEILADQAYVTIPTGPATSPKPQPVRQTTDITSMSPGDILDSMVQPLRRPDAD